MIKGVNAHVSLIIHKIFSNNHNSIIRYSLYKIFFIRSSDELSDGAFRFREVVLFNFAAILFLM